MFEKDPDFMAYERDCFVFDNCRIIRASAKALMVKFPSGQRKWVPRYHVLGNDLDKAGDVGTLEVTEKLFNDWTADGFDPEDEVKEPSVAISGVVCLEEREKAIKCKMPWGAKEWFPVSQILPRSQVRYDGDSGTLEITEWFAEKNDISATGPVKTAQSDLKNNPHEDEDFNLFGDPEG